MTDHDTPGTTDAQPRAAHGVSGPSILPHLESDIRSGWVRPDYDGYCLSNVLPTAGSVLGLESDRTLPDAVLEGIDSDVSNILVVLIDGLRVDRWAETSVDLFERAKAVGRTTTLTSVYPSETAAAIVSYHTGRQPIEHGSLGWEQYLPEHGLTIEPLRGRTVDRDPLHTVVDPGSLTLFEGETMHAVLGRAGIESTVVQPKRTLSHDSAPLLYAGADRRPYTTPADGAMTALEALSGPEPAIATLYLPEIDSLSHRFGTETAHYEGTLHLIASALEYGFGRVDPAQAAETLVVLTADHGHVDATAGAGHDLRQIDVVCASLRRDDEGNPIGPTGSLRNVHLHLKPGTVDRVADALADLEVHCWTRLEALEGDLFGTREPSETFEQRCGDLIVVPEKVPVWTNPTKFDMIGQHGGLRPEEMLVPLTTVPLDRLISRASGGSE